MLQPFPMPRRSVPVYHKRTLASPVTTVCGHNGAMKYMVGLHSQGECSVASTASPGCIGATVAGGGSGGGDKGRERVTCLIRPSVAPTSFDDPISGWGGLVPVAAGRSSSFLSPQPAQMFFSVMGGGWTVGASCSQGSHVHGGLHPFGIGLISPVERWWVSGGLVWEPG